MVSQKKVKALLPKEPDTDNWDAQTMDLYFSLKANNSFVSELTKD
jgi:hypothetical protein